MTRQEFYEKYGDTKVSFTSYYKYTFTYTGTREDGTKVTCEVGGGTDDIYRFSVEAGEAVSLRELDPYAGTARLGTEGVDDFYDY